MAFRLMQSVRFISTNGRNLTNKQNAIYGINLVEKVAVTDDGRTIAAWHPDVDYPYELTRPIPNLEEIQSSAFIKEKALQNAMSAFGQKHPEIARQELMKLTHTTKHRWFPRARDKRAKDTPMDRPYL